MSHAEGFNCVAFGSNSYAGGWRCSSIGIASYTHGASNVATGTASHAEGQNTSSINTGSHTEGIFTIASGGGSHAEGWSTFALGNASHAEGASNYASQMCAHAEGSNTQATAIASHSEGINTVASGLYSHTEGWSTFANGTASHAEGSSNVAFANYSHVEGLRNSTIGVMCHAEGFSNVAFGSNSHVGGWSCSSIGVASYAHGASNTAASSFSGVLAGYCNITNAICATAVGQFVNARNINALTFAGAAHSTSSAVYLGGTVQTFMTTLGGVMPTTNTEVPMSLFSDTAGTATSNISINILNGSNYFCHTVALDLTGYEKAPGTGTAGNGIFAGTYKFLVYWDNAASSIAYIADRGGVKATSGGSVTLTAIDATNMLSNGTATVTVRAYMTSNVAGANYSITAQSTGYPLNWLAQVRVGELMSAK
jgi:hypothetical protein